MEFHSIPFQQYVHSFSWASPVESSISSRRAYLSDVRSGLTSGRTAGYDSEMMKKYMSDNFETVIPDLLENYHLLCEIYEISGNGVFSTRTMAMLEQQESTPLQQREAELSSLEAEERTIAKEEALVYKQTEKEEQNIGEE